jgi:hypothetical protein
MADLEFNEQNWKECLESLGFTESENVNFGGMIVYNDKGIPTFDYTSEERKRQLYIFLSGAVYWQIHTMFS